jgi:hypothetical protein
LINKQRIFFDIYLFEIKEKKRFHRFPSLPFIPTHGIEIKKKQIHKYIARKGKMLLSQMP